VKVAPLDPHRATSYPRALPDLGAQALRLVTALREAAPANGHAQSADPAWYHAELMNALGVAMYTTDAAGRITFFNDAAATFWGRRPSLGEEWCGTLRLYWTDGTPMRHDECPMAMSLREDRAVRGYEAIAERPDGSRRFFVPYPTPLHGPDGDLIGAVNVLVDVTERRQAEEALRTAAESLAASNAVKDQFLGLISHELRTPVTTIFGNTELLRDRGDRLETDVKQTMIGDIAHDSERLLGIIENLLHLTRLESAPQVELEPQVLAHVVRTSIEAFGRRHPEREIRLRCEPRHLIVDADRTSLELVLENLLGNANKYSPPGSEVEVVIRSLEGAAEVVVLDRGIGIDESEAALLFTPFYRAAAAKTRAGGLGIGLALCKRIAETQGGRVWAEARPGGGSAFGFAVALATEPAGES